MFVGQREEGFAVNLGQIFDLVNMGVSALGVTPASGQADLTGAADQGKNIAGDKNITTLAIEVPASCLTKDATHPIIARLDDGERCARRACSTRPRRSRARRAKAARGSRSRASACRSSTRS